MPAVTPAPLASGDPEQLGRYRLLGRLGEGGMGTVYLGSDPAERLVAVKVIRADLAMIPEFRVRFRREADLARRIARFCTAEVLDIVDPADGSPPYLVTEFVDGPTLAQAVEAGGPLGSADLERVAVSVAAALTAIHSAGLVHRDLKPSNVMLSPLGPRVIDFGIARALDSTSMISQDAQRIGTPAFMAPEQVNGEAVTPRADIFAWGGLVTYAGTGRFPFGEGAVPVQLYRVVHLEPLLDGLDPALRPIVEHAMDKDPLRRPSAQELFMRLVGLGSATHPDPEVTALIQTSGLPFVGGTAAAAAAGPGTDAGGGVPAGGGVAPAEGGGVPVKAWPASAVAAGPAAPTPLAAAPTPVPAAPPVPQQSPGTAAAGPTPPVAPVTPPPPPVVASLSTPSPLWMPSLPVAVSPQVPAVPAVPPIPATPPVPVPVPLSVPATPHTAPPAAATASAVPVPIPGAAATPAEPMPAAHPPAEQAAPAVPVVPAVPGAPSPVPLPPPPRRRQDISLRTALLAAVAAVVLVAAVAVPLALTDDGGGGDESARLAASVAAEAERVRPTDAGLAGRLSLAAYRISPVLEARRSLVTSFSGQVAAAAEGHSLSVLGVAVSVDGGTVATAAADDTVRLWDITDITDGGEPRELTVLTGHEAWVVSAAFSPDGRTLATTSYDKTVILWGVADPAAPVRRTQILGHNGYVLDVAFSPDGSLLATSGYDNAARVWDVTNVGTPRERGVLDRHTSWVNEVVFSADGRLAATASADVSARLWDLTNPADPRALATLTAHTDFVWTLAFSPDGRTLATGGYDGMVWLWDIADPAQPRSFGQVRADPKWVLDVAFSPDGRTLATAGWDSKIHLWDVTDPGAVVDAGTIGGHGDWVQDIVFLPDGSAVASGSDDMTLRISPIEPEAVAAAACADPANRISEEEWGRLIPDAPYRPAC